MELFVVAVVALCLGAIVRFTLPRRESYGIALVPAAAAIVTIAAWVGLTWLGWPADEAGIWLVTLALGILAAVILALSLPPARSRRDERRFTELANGR